MVVWSSSWSILVRCYHDVSESRRKILYKHRWFSGRMLTWVRFPVDAFCNLVCEIEIEKLRPWTCKYISLQVRRRLFHADVAEWLRRLIRNHFHSGSVGPNPTICVIAFCTKFTQINLFEISYYFLYSDGWKFPDMIFVLYALTLHLPAVL
jgi:hypothetical protein